MKTLVLADSSLCIRAGREFGDPFGFFTLHSDDYEFATCGVVMVEVLRGVKDPEVMESWRQEFNRLIYLPTNQSTWDRARKIAWDFERRGRRLGTPDIIIAACAFEANAAVLTLDKRFAEIPGLRVLSGL